MRFQYHQVYRRIWDLIVSVPDHCLSFYFSVRGPVICLLYINDLPDNVQSQVRLFADDTAVYLTANHPEDSALLQRDLD